MANPTVSVVIPAFNEEKYLKDCLTALKNQTVPPLEIILVDNNSTDTTAAIAIDFGCRVASESTQGYVFTLNHGMQEAKGEVIAVTDADTIVEPNWIEEISQAFVDQAAVGLTGSIKMRGTFGWFSSFLYFLFLKVNFLVGKPHLVGFNFATRAETFRQSGGLNLEYIIAPDVELGLRLKKFGKVILATKVKVLASGRRWEKRFFQTLLEYFGGYFSTVWLGRPVKIKQKVIR